MILLLIGFFLLELMSFAKWKTIWSLSSKNYYYDSWKIRFAWAIFNKYTWTTRHTGINEDNQSCFNLNYPTDYSVGSCVLFSVDILKKVWLFDSGYFMYSEDLDLSIRILKTWLENYYIGNSFIYHKVSASSNKMSNKAAFYAARNRVITVRKNYNSIVYYVFIFIFLCKVMYRSFIKDPINLNFLKWYLYWLFRKF